VLFYVLFVCDCVLPPGDNPIAVNKMMMMMIIIVIIIIIDDSVRRHFCGPVRSTGSGPSACPSVLKTEADVLCETCA
jgi:hypothetical protein